MGFCLFVVKRPTNTLWINKNTTSFHATKQIYLTIWCLSLCIILTFPRGLKISGPAAALSQHQLIPRFGANKQQYSAPAPNWRDSGPCSTIQRQAHPKLSWSGSLHIFLLHWSTELVRSYFCSDAQGSLKPYFVALLLISQGYGPNVSMYWFKHQRFQSKYAFCTVEDFWRIIWLLTTFSTFLPM